MTRRYAIYAAPAEGSALAHWGAAWLGRDAAGGESRSRPILPGWNAEALESMTAAPRHYGLHATLKPPFRLAARESEAALFDGIEALAAAQPAPPPMRLRPALLDGFLALVPAEDGAELRALADNCVSTLDRFRAPAGEAELVRRRKGGLTLREEQHLLRWGYPYVFDMYRFHLTLTGRLSALSAGELLRALGPELDPLLREPLALNDIALFIQEFDIEGEGQPFQLVRRFPLQTVAQEYHQPEKPDEPSQR